MCFLYLAIIPIYWQIKSLFLYIGVEFFLVWPFIAHHPRYRKALGPWWWVLHGVPTDAEWVIQVLQQRAKENRPVKSAKSIKRKKAGGVRDGLAKLRTHNRSRDSMGSLSSIGSFESDDVTVKDGESIKPGKRRWREKLLDSGAEALHRVTSVRPSCICPSPPQAHRADTSWSQSESVQKLLHSSTDSDEDKKPLLAPRSRSRGGSDASSIGGSDDTPRIRSFALLNGKAPGTLVVTSSKILFEPIRGFRTAAAASLLKSGGSAVKPGGGDKGSVPPASNVLLALEDLTSVKKVKSFGLGGLGGDGLELVLKDKTVSFCDYRFFKCGSAQAAMRAGRAIGECRVEGRLLC